jgi:hypothetical protein
MEQGQQLLDAAEREISRRIDAAKHPHHRG